MKAWVLRNIGQIEYMDMSKPVPAPGEALIRVQAAGICGSDVPRVYQTGAHRMPLIIGHEFSGIVESVNPRDCSEAEVDEWTGKRVGIFPLIPCGECGPCKQGRHEMCRRYDYVGSRRDGAFAEYVTVPMKNLIELPDEVSYEEAAMLEPMAVAVHAMRRSLGSTDRSVCVCGLGTMGLLLTQFLLEAGYHDICFIGRRDSQKQLLERIVGTDMHYCDSRFNDPGKWIASGGLPADGFDLFFDCVGTNECIDYAVRCTAPGGSIVLVGNPASDISLERNVYWKILRNQITLTGTWNSSFYSEDDDWHYVSERLRDKRIRPDMLISHRLPLDGLEHGLRIMRDKSEDYCKIMITSS